MEKAKSTFSDMKRCAKGQMWEAAANRIYYALFHAMSALLINDGHNVKGHRGVMVLFGQHYIRTGIFKKEDGALLSNLIIMRDNADYNCFYEADEEKIGPYIEPTRQLIQDIQHYITQHPCE